MSEPAHERYTAIAIILHWAIAAAVLFQLVLGFWMHEAIEHSESIVVATAAFQLHKSVGLSVLALSIIRLGWRVANPAPSLPAHMPDWEKFAARATHWAFYFLILAMPLSGWLYVSTGWSVRDDHALAVTTRYFGLFSVPPLFDLLHATEATRRSLAFIAGQAHWILAWTMSGLAVLHVAAALKHQFVDRDETLAHMVPGLRAPNETTRPPGNAVRRAVLGVGFAAIFVAIAGVGYAVMNLVPAAPIAAVTTGTETTAVVTETPMPTTAVSGARANTPAGAPPAWRVDANASSIAFAATYVDDEGETRFNGRFTSWRADIRFDPANLEGSRAVVTIDMASARDGIPYHEQTLPAEPWFNVPGHPTAEFRTSSIRHVSGDNYEARGRLSIKGRSVNVTLPFTLTISGDRASMNGRVSLSREAMDVGVRDPEGNDHVSPSIDVTVRVEATHGS